jgi:hypothetical protein
MGPAAMPMPGTSKAPRKFRGHYWDVIQFVTHLDRLFTQFGITNGKDKVTLALDYCSKSVRSFIQTTLEYARGDWDALKLQFLSAYDAERNDPIYSVMDVIEYVHTS